jgi:hypothetical protein
MSGALHLAAFDQPAEQGFFSNLLNERRGKTSQGEREYGQTD